jgi:hypothetical protein
MSFEKLVTVGNVNDVIAQIKNKTSKPPFSPVFADIYIDESIDNKKDAQTGERIKPAEKIDAARPADPVQELFSQMRQLSREISRASFSEERYRERLFFKQAQFIAGFEDDYQDTAPFSMYFPYYQLMNYEQLRTYFTWRSKVRAGNITETDLSYVFLYVYELINNIGVLNSEDGIDKLLSFWNAYRPYSKKPDKYMAAWIRDYFILNPCPYTFNELLQREPLLQKYYPMNTDKYSMDFYEAISVYKIKQSIFYTIENKKLITECFDYIIQKLNELMSKENRKFNDLIFDRGVECRWEPFSNAIFYMKPEYWPKGSKTVKISDEHEYRYKNGKWTYTIGGIYSAGSRHLIGYIFKRMELLLRRVTKFKYKLNVNDKLIDKRHLDKLLPGIGSAGFLSAIDQAVKEYYINSRKTVVKVDENNLIKIRQNALITQEKLIISEDTGDGEAPDTSTEPTDIPTTEALPPPAAALPAEKSPAVEAEQKRSAAPVLGDIWGSFAQSLEPAEITALKNIHDGISVKALAAFAKDSGLMLEVLLDGINQKALDAMGDTILELSDEIVVYDEYKALWGKAVYSE